MICRFGEETDIERGRFKDEVDEEGSIKRGCFKDEVDGERSGKKSASIGCKTKKSSLI